MLPYVSRDVATEPPTTVVIVSSTGQPPELINNDEAVFAITEDCVEPTQGWQNREGKPLLTICFMHSFGKCAGRTNSDPRTCFQIHVKPHVLNALRRHYTNPTRRYFTRTIKAQLNPELRYQLSVKAHKELKVQYLEYRVQDTYPSAGLQQYEAAYRTWLFSDDQKTESGANITVMQCTLFASTGACPSNTDCPFIHAHPRNAQVRDPILSRALQDLCDGPTCAVWSSTNPSNDEQHNRGRDNVGMVAASVPIYTLLPTQDSCSGPKLVPVQYAQIQESTATVPINYSSTKTHGHSVYPNHTAQKASHSQHQAHEASYAVGKGTKENHISDGDDWFTATSAGGISVNPNTGSSGSGSD